MSEPEHLKILSLEEVRELAQVWKPDAERSFTACSIVRLCVTVERWKAAFDEAEADRLRMDGAGKKLAGHFVDEQAKNARLSALAARMREALSELHALECEGDDPEMPSYTSLRREVEALLADTEGESAAEELRLLRAWEAAQRNVYDTHYGEPRTQEEKDAQERAIICEEEAWTALDDFRERTK